MRLATTFCRRWRSTADGMLLARRRCYSEPLVSRLHQRRVINLPLLPETLLTPEDEELERKQTSLAEHEAQLADREGP